MSDNNTTPGPWHVKFSKFSEVVATNGAVIAKVQKLNGLVQVQSDARLIASAPELLAIVQKLANLRDGLENSNSSAEEAAARLSAQACTALAKARGES